MSHECEVNKLSSTYSEKIKELRSAAQETQAAIKIRDKLTDLRSKDVLISSYRWIWELIQNAKDCPNTSGKINIEILFDSLRRIVEFKHNGKLFSTKNIVYLIEQVSTKDRTRNSENTGKFGTGFLTTNLLSPVVKISGLLHDDDDDKIASFEVTLDRSGSTIDKLKNSIKNSCDQLESNTSNISYSITGNEMNTSFLYLMDENGMIAAKNGLENFLITAPYVFAFVPELNQITINNNGETSVYTRTQKGDTHSENVFVSRILKNGEATPINILTIVDEMLMLAVEVKQINGENHIAHYNDYLPKLFCDFPLLGTHDFSFPVVINSKRFDPNEPRNGILLFGDESEQNKEILKNACLLYTSLIDYFLQNNYKEIYSAVHLPQIVSKDWIDRYWYEENIISLLKNKISEFKMFTMTDESKQALCDEWGQENIFLSSDDSEEIRDAVWQLSSQLHPDKTICNSDVEKWYSSLWEECRNYGVAELIAELESIGSLDRLSAIVSDAVEYLNQLYNLIYVKCSGKTDITMRSNKIFPNQHGQFCLLNELKEDGGIDEVFKNAADMIGIDLRSELADNRFSFRSISIMSFNDAAYRMIIQAQNDVKNKADNFYLYIIGIHKGSISKQASFISVYNALYSGSPIIVFNAYNYSDKLLDNAIDRWCNIICYRISQCVNLSNFSSSNHFISIDAAILWIANFIQYLQSVDKAEMLDKYAIIPNQNGILKKKSVLYRDSDAIPEFMKDVCRIAGTDYREEMALIQIDTSIVPRRIGYKDVSGVITNYIRDHMNNIRVSPEEKTSFDQTYKWLRENRENTNVKQHFSELLEHLYWFYNDDEIAESVAKATELDTILSKYGFSDISQLEKMLIHKTTEHSLSMSIEEVLARYGISTQEELQRLIDSHVLGEDFLHTSEASLEKFEYVQRIIQRAISNIKAHLIKIGYDLNNSAEIHKTIFTASINGREIYVIARPSDYDEVILYYDAEFETLDYTKDFELWVDNGKTNPEKLTFGRILKLTGVNRIPLRRIVK